MLLCYKMLTFMVWLRMLKLKTVRKSYNQENKLWNFSPQHDYVHSLWNLSNCSSIFSNWWHSTCHRCFSLDPFSGCMYGLPCLVKMNSLMWFRERRRCSVLSHSHAGTRGLLTSLGLCWLRLWHGCHASFKSPTRVKGGRVHESHSHRLLRREIKNLIWLVLKSNKFLWCSNLQ